METNTFSKNSNSQLSVLLPSFSLHFSRCLSSPSRKGETITPLTRYQSPIPLCHQTESCSSKCPGTKSHDYWEDILATKGNAESLKVKKKQTKKTFLWHMFRYFCHVSVQHRMVMPPSSLKISRHITVHSVSDVYHTLMRADSGAVNSLLSALNHPGKKSNCLQSQEHLFILIFKLIFLFPRWKLLRQ